VTLQVARKGIWNCGVHSQKRGSRSVLQTIYLLKLDILQLKLFHISCMKLNCECLTCALMVSSRF
jgi:ubiquitin C-terminal hydrolase